MREEEKLWNPHVGADGHHLDGNPWGDGAPSPLGTLVPSAPSLAPWQGPVPPPQDRAPGGGSPHCRGSDLVSPQS